MRKLLITFTLIISVFVFYINYLDFAQKELNKFNLIINTLEENLDETYFALGINLYNDSDHQNDVKLQKLLDFVYDNEYPVLSLASRQNNDYTRTQEISLFTKDINQTLDGIYFKNHPKNTEALSNGRFISMDQHNQDAYDYFDVFSDQYLSRYQLNFELYSIDHIADYTHNTFFLFIYGDADEIKQVIKESDILPLLDERWEDNPNLGYAPVSDQVEKTSMTALLVSLICMVLVSICLCYEKSKELVIRKMCGQGNQRIFRHLFTKTFIGILSAYVIGQGICFMIVVQHFGESVYSFLQVMGGYFLLSVLITILAYGLIYVVLSKKVKVDTLKQSKTNKRIIKVNMALKLVLLLLMMQPVITYCSTGFLMFENLMFMKQHEASFRNLIGVNSIEIVTEEQFKDDIKKLKAVFQENHAYYENFSQVNAIDGKGERLLNYIIVNKRFLSEYRIEDISNTAVDVQALAHNTLLIPEKFKQEKLNQFCDQSKCDEIIIKDGYQFIKHYPTLLDDSIATSPIILVKDEIDEHCSENSQNMMLRIDDNFTLDDVASMMKHAKLNTDVDLISSNETFDYMAGKALDELMSTGMIVFIYLAVAIIFIYQNIYITFMERRKELSIRCLLGHSFMMKYGGIISFNNATYVIALLAGYFLFHMRALPVILFTIIFSCIENLIQLRLIRYFEKKKIIPTLKGE